MKGVFFINWQHDWNIVHGRLCSLYSLKVYDFSIADFRTCIVRVSNLMDESVIN